MPRRRRMAFSSKKGFSKGPRVSHLVPPKDSAVQVGSFGARVSPQPNEYGRVARVDGTHEEEYNAFQAHKEKLPRVHWAQGPVRGDPQLALAATIPARAQAGRGSAPSPHVERARAAPSDVSLRSRLPCLRCAGRVDVKCRLAGAICHSEALGTVS